jgi:hypothetical protein
MPTWLKHLAFLLTPRLATAISSSRGRRRSHRLVKKWGLFDINRRVIAEFGNRVLDGPFSGLILTDLAHHEHIGPYVLGTYECELHGWWVELFRRQFSQIIDVGSSFGYYAVGLARQFTNTPVFAFDVDWWARRATRQMAAANRTPNLVVKGFCTPSWLATNLKDHALVVSDCEGAEARLFCQQMIPAFRSSTFVVELHEAFVPGVTANFVSAFGRSHTFQTIDSRSDTVLPGRPTALSAAEWERAAHEVRGPQQWLMLTPAGRG